MPKERSKKMKKYDVITIGFGQGARKIARQLAKQKWKVAMIEKDDEMYGGSCINIGCIPTKMMEHDARAGKSYGEIIERRDQVVERNRNGNYNRMQDNEFVDVYTGLGSFQSNHVVEVKTDDGVVELEAKYIVIDTGSTPFMPPIEGLDKADRVYDSTGLQKLPSLPKKLGIIGGGNIGLEFSSIYSTMGSKVTIFERGAEFMSREEPVIAEAIKEVLEDKGVKIFLNTEAQAISNQGDQVVVQVSDEESHSFDALLVAVGRKPQTEGLNLEATDVELDDKGGIKVNDHLETAASHVYATGDVRGKYKFTYITTSDADIVLDHLLGDGGKTLSDREYVPYAVFIDPPLGRVGMTEAQAKEEGLPYLTKTVPMKFTTRSDIIDDKRGVYKAVVNKETNEILGASMFGDQSHELIHLVKMAMDNKIPYTYLRDGMKLHPVMTEVMGSLFNME
jgi:pyruvate/2-oxoglutarate dehydrogenase complex dihydrolipoamide dehydrogenase (E3) component